MCMRAPVALLAHTRVVLRAIRRPIISLAGGLASDVGVETPLLGAHRSASLEMSAPDDVDTAVAARQTHVTAVSDVIVSNVERGPSPPPHARSPMQANCSSELSAAQSEESRRQRDANVHVIVKTLGPSFHKTPNLQATPTNSEFTAGSAAGCFYGCSTCPVCCACCATRPFPAGRDGVEQLRVAFGANDFLYDLGAREHKRITIVRHGESEANAYTRSWPVLLSCRCCCDPGLVDPSLSPDGLQKALALGLQLTSHNYLAEHEIELIVVSPLRRALQTALALFPPATHHVPFLVTPLHREVTDTSGDLGSPVEELAAEFPDFQFELADHWWRTDNVDGVHEESHASVQKRILDFSAFLMRLKQFKIVIVGHSAFFKAWTRQSSKMQNLEFKTYELCAD